MPSPAVQRGELISGAEGDLGEWRIVGSVSWRLRDAGAGLNWLWLLLRSLRRLQAGLLRWRGEEGASGTGTDILLSGGVAGIVTWASIYPLDVVKTRSQVSLDNSGRTSSATIARRMLEREGTRSFYRGLGVCSCRAFVVNAIQVSFHLSY